MASPDPRPPRGIARTLAVGFGAVAAVSVAMAIVLSLVVLDVSNLVLGMRGDEGAIRDGFELATRVREQSALAARLLLGKDASELEGFRGELTLIRASAARLGPFVPEAERWRLDALEKTTRGLYDHVVGFALPAALGGDVATARLHHREIAELSRAAAEHADALARAVEARMTHAHVMATHSTEVGLFTGAVGVALVVGLSVAFTVRLRRAVLRPLATLTDAARRFGEGDLSLRVGAVGEGELRTLARTFDAMADELSAREERVVKNERMAAIGQLAAGVAHELNNPIGIIRGYLKTMDPDGDPATLKEELAILDEEAAACQRIAEDLVTYARPGELGRERFSARVFLEETARRFQGTAVARDAHIALDLEDATLDADRARLRQVILNLLTNAAQASPEAQIELSGRVVDAGYEIAVADAGPGVSPEDRDRIFEPFFGKRRGGSGLGLSVCLGIVEAHGGEIGVADREGGGARFTVRLPREVRG